MFKTAAITTAFVLFATHQLTTTGTAPIGESFETASYCDWVMTFEEGVTETPSWCADEPSEG